MDFQKKFLSIDLGATSGRLLLGLFDGRKLTYKEIHRFRNEPVQVNGGLYWDILKLFQDVKHGLRRCGREHGCDISALGVDAWGVDFGLIAGGGNLLENPRHYRDSRTEGIANEVASMVDGYEAYATTGTRIVDSTTICQLYSMVKRKSPHLGIAESFLLIPCLVNYFLSGIRLQEHSIMTTTALHDVVNDAPAAKLFEGLGIPMDMMPEVVRPGARIGKLLAEVADETELGPVEIMAPATHDTASAVVSVPAGDDANWAFLSCGTWSVLGIETDRPITTRQSHDMGITNSSTAFGRFMTIDIIMGLWIVEECRRVWAAQDTALEYQDLMEMARQARPFGAFIDVNDRIFLNPVDMPKAIGDYCRNTSQNPPEDTGAIIRLALESLALRCKDALRRIEAVSGRKIDVLHMVGGGARNDLLCRFTANATGVPVLAGPFEATSLGNIVVQMAGAGEIRSASEGRALLRQSLDLVEYIPEDLGGWDEAYQRYRTLLRRREEC